MQVCVFISFFLHSNVFVLFLFLYLETKQTLTSAKILDHAALLPFVRIPQATTPALALTATEATLTMA